MAGTTVSTPPSAPKGSDVRAMLVHFNKLVDDVETLRAAVDAIADKLDADATVTDTNYAATAAVATAGTMTAAKVAHQGTVVADV